jgi:hypothetical protein
VITGYRSPRQTVKQTSTFYDQQYALLAAKGVAKPNVRKAFIVDLISYVQDLQAKGHEVMVNLDANENLGQDKTFGLQTLIDTCSLRDLHSIVPGEAPATYKYGHHRRIDYMLGTKAVSENVVQAGFLSYEDSIFSKHRGLFLDLNFARLLELVSDPTMQCKQSRFLLGAS